MHHRLKGNGYLPTMDIEMNLLEKIEAFFEVDWLDYSEYYELGPWMDHEEYIKEIHESFLL
jgi:hypothetical protein